MSIVKAVRAHYAALQHRPAADRVPLYFSVQGYDRRTLLEGWIWVKAPTEGRRKAEMTKLQNRLAAMYPVGFVDAAASIHVWYSRGDSRTWVHVNGVDPSKAWFNCDVDNNAEGQDV